MVATAEVVWVSTSVVSESVVSVGKSDVCKGTDRLNMVFDDTVDSDCVIATLEVNRVVSPGVCKSEACNDVDVL